MIEVETTNHQTAYPIDESLVRDIAQLVLQGEGANPSRVSIAVVDRRTMQQLNRRFLQHDFPTDVLTFPAGLEEGRLSGEVIVCADVAAEAARRFGWRTMDELLLYVVHGVLHLVGYDDTSSEERVAMRRQEQHYLSKYDLKPRYDDGPEARSKVGSTHKRKRFQNEDWLSDQE